MYDGKVTPIRMIVMDVDGVLTDGGIIYKGPDTELKRFHIQDGMGITMAIKAGFRVGILTGRSSPMVERRARELSIPVVKQGFHTKIEGWQEILREEEIGANEVAYIGDDVQDLPVLWRAGFSAAPANAVAEVKSDVDYVCQRSGGHGAVREFIDLLLAEKGIKAEVIAAFTGKKP
ncbi:MAG TPA: HAD hydrolase family protein [Candidatus Polarisedimenticolia bacterium]|jgi:3-deoxy-D-manno-octulosonate 8-phosphate phosphatase (KDO 8-P phosphatase)